MERRNFEVHAADGRRLLAEVAGPEDGHLVVIHAGTPGTRHLFEGHLEEAAARGLRQVCYSRPGYGGSDRLLGRSFADCAADVAAIADALGADSFDVVGYSGGGPHALACAALLPSRVLSTHVLGGVAPRDAEGLDWLGGAAEENQEEFAALEAGDAALERFLSEATAEMREIKDGQGVLDALGGLLSDADLRCLAGPMLDYEAECWREVGHDEIWGWFDDDKALWMDWGFDLDQVTGRATIWHGGDDQMVPVSHAKWLAERLPNAELRLFPGEGHVSLFARHYADLLDELVASSV